MSGVVISGHFGKELNVTAENIILKFLTSSVVWTQLCVRVELPVY